MYDELYEPNVFRQNKRKIIKENILYCLLKILQFITWVVSFVPNALQHFVLSSNTILYYCSTHYSIQFDDNVYLPNVI